MAGVAWTDEEAAVFDKMKAEGATSRQIGVALGRSRNAVIGRAQRLGLNWQRPPKAPQADGNGPETAVVLRQAIDPPVTVDPVPCPREVAQSAVSVRPTVETIRANSCRFALWETTPTRIAPRDAFFCGAPTSATQSYCETHRAIVFQTYTPKKVAKAPLRGPR